MKNIIFLILALAIIANPTFAAFTNTSQSGYNYEETSGIAQMYVKTNPSTADSILIIKDGFQFTIQPFSLNYRNSLNQLEQIDTIQTVTGIPNNSTFIYPNAFGAGINLTYLYQPQLQVKELLVINNSNTLPIPAAYILANPNVTLDMDFQFGQIDGDIYIDGVLWDRATTKGTTGKVEIKNPINGDVIFALPQPYAYDSNGGKIIGSYEFKKSGPKIYVVIKIPYLWLNSTSRIFPIYIDPTVLVGTSVTGSGGSNFVMRSVNGTHIWVFASQSNIPYAYKSLNGGNTFSAGIGAASTTGAITSTSNVGPELVMAMADTASFIFNISSETWSAAGAGIVGSSYSRPLGLRDGSVVVFRGNAGANCQIFRSTNLGTSWTQVTTFGSPIVTCSDGLKAMTQTPDGYIWVVRGCGAGCGGTLIFNVSNSTWASPSSTILLNNYDSNGGALISSPNGTIYAYMLNATSMTSIKISDTTKAVLAHVNVSMAFNATLTGNQEGGGMSYDVNTKNLYFSSNNGTSIQHRVTIWNSTNDGMTWNMVTPAFVVPAGSWRPWLSGWQSYYSYALNSSSNATLEAVYFNQSAPSFGIGYSSFEISSFTGPPASAVTLTIQSPTNTSYSFTNITLNYTITNTTAIDKCWYTLNGGTSVFVTNCINTTFIASQGNTNLSLYVNLTDGTNTMKSVNFFVDSISPTVSIQSPTNTSYNFLNITLNYTRNDTNALTCIRELNGVNATISGCINTTILAVNGGNTVKVYVIDTVNNSAVASVQFTADNVTPTSTVTSPANTTYNTLSIARTFTVSDNLGVVTCVQELNGVNTSLPTCANGTITAAQGYNIFKLYVLDSVNNSNVSTVRFLADTIFPSVFIDAPTNTTYLFQNTTFNYRAIDSFVGNCTYSLNGVNKTVNGCINTTFLAANGANTLILYVNDTAGNQNSTTVQFTTDFLAPVLILISPTNTTYISNKTLPLLYTAYDPVSNVTCHYHLNGGGANPLPGCANETLNMTYLGWYTLDLTATDSFGNTNTSTTNWTIADNPPTINIQAPTNTTYYSTNISLNFTVNDIDLDSCWYTLDSGTVTPLPSCLNITVIVPSGSHRFSVSANDSWNVVGNSTVNFTVFQGLNLSTFLPNGTALTAWNVTIANSTTSVTFGGSNPTLLISSAMPNGNVSVNVFKSGYDNETWNTFINGTNGIQQRNFTLYPINYIYLKEDGGPLLSNWFITISTVNISNTTVPTFYTISSRTLPAIITTFTGTKNAYTPAIATFNVSSNIAFNLTLNATKANIIIQALDEITRENLGFTADVRAHSTNATYFSITAYRNSVACLYDNDASTQCVGGQDNPSPMTSRHGVAWGQDFTNATYFVAYRMIVPVGGCSNGMTVTIFANRTVGGIPDILYSGGFTSGPYPAGTDLTANATFVLDNSNGTYPRVVNFTLQLDGSRCGVVYNTYGYNEFKQLSNTNNYTYVDNYKVTFPIQNVISFDALDIWFTGQLDKSAGQIGYQPEYSAPRMLRATVTPQSNYNLDGYLLKDALGYMQYFTVLDTAAANQPVSNALLSLSKWYNSVRTTIAQCASNPGGSCGIWLRANAEYGFNKYKSGYQTQDEPFTVFTSNPNPLIIYMAAGQNLNFTSVFGTLSVQGMPTEAYLSSPFNASCQILAPDGNLNNMNFTVTRWENGTEYPWNSTYVNNQPTGATILWEVTQSGRYSLNCQYAWVANQSGVPTVFTQYNKWDVWMYTDALQNQGQAFGSPLALILAMGVILFIAGGISLYHVGYGVGVGILLLVAFAWMGFIGWYVAGLAILTAISLVFLRTVI